MTQRTKQQAKEHRRQMREQGYTDGHAGREARWADATYQRSWRLGREAAAREAAEEDAASR